MITKFRKRKKDNFWKEVFLPAVLGLLVVVIIGFLIFKSLEVHQRRIQLVSRLESLKERIEELERKKDILQVGISQAEKEEYIEKIAKEELNLQKEGEKAVGFILPEEKREDRKREENFWFSEKGLMFLLSIVVVFSVTIGLFSYCVFKKKKS